MTKQDQHRERVERATWAFNLHWQNDEPLYRAVIMFGRVCLGRVPNMTDQTLGRNVRDAVRRWCVDRQVTGLGWDADLGYPPVSRSVLAMLAEEVGEFNLVSEETVGEEVREAMVIEA